MANQIRRGSELSNISETWDQNESKRQQQNTPENAGASDDTAPAANDLEQTIKEEAAEYDTVNKEDRVLGGDRATLNDDAGDTAEEQ